MARLAAAALLLLVSACAPPTARDAPPPGATRVLLDVPHRSERAKRGAPAALASVLSFWGRETPTRELLDELDRDSFSASLSGDLQKAARVRGFSAELFDATLAQVREQLDKGRPLLALVEQGPPFRRSGRWLVITGYDVDRRGFYAHIGRTAHRLLSYEEFYARWSRTRRAAILVRPATTQAADAAHSSGMQRTR